MTPLLILSAIAFSIAGVGGFVYHNKLVALWLTYAGVALSLAAITLWIQEIITRPTQNTADVKERPWLSIEVVPAGDITFKQDGNATFPLRFATNNSGSMPANNARLSAEIVLAKPGGPELLTGPVKRRDEICKGAFLDTTGTWKFGTVFAKPVEVEIAFSVDSPTISEQFGSTVIGPFVVGCVTYEFSANEHRFAGQTGFIYEIAAASPGKRGTRYIPLGENIPESEVVIRKPAINADFAK